MFSMYWGVPWSSSFKDFSYFSLVYKTSQTLHAEGSLPFGPTPSGQEEASQALHHPGPSRSVLFRHFWIHQHLDLLIR